MKPKQTLPEKPSLLSEGYFRAVFEQTDRMLFTVDVETGHVVSFNNKTHQQLGYSRKAFSKLKLSDFSTGDTSGPEKRPLRPFNKNGEGDVRTQYRTKKGALLDVRVRIKAMTHAKKTWLLFDAQEISARKLSDKFKRLSTAIFEAATEAILVTDAEGTILSVNPAFTRITGYSAAEVLGKNPRILQSGRQNKAFYKKMWGAIHAHGHWQGEIWNRRKNGKIYPEWLSITAVKDEEDHSVQYAALFSDITQRKAGQAKLERQAYYDPLTRLPNRTLFLERLSQAIKLTRRNQGKAALIFVDLDRFKAVNDSLGHTAGDAILKQSADRLLACVRETDTVARTGGDEYLIVLTNINSKEEASIVAQKILEQFSAPFIVNRRKVALGASIGIAMVPENGEEHRTLIENADLAMYRSKTTGRNTHYFFHPIMKKTAKQNAEKKRAPRKPAHSRTPS